MRICHPCVFILMVTTAQWVRGAFWGEDRSCTAMWSQLYGGLKIHSSGLPWWLSGKEPTGQCRRRGFDPLSTKTQHTPETTDPGL